MASSFLGAFTSLISGRPWGDLPASFCYTIGEKVPLPYGSVFQLFDGVNSSDKSKVSVFIFDKKTSNLPASVAAIHLDYARSCLKSIRTIRHPYIIRTLEVGKADDFILNIFDQALEVPSGIYLVTEFVRPLVSSDIPSDPIWGIFQIASAVEFLHSDVKTVHGLICPFSVFVTVDEAHWRLSGFDVVRPLISFGTSVSHDFQTAIKEHPLRGSGYSPPLDSVSPFGVDRWGLASLIAWVYASLKASADSKLHLPLTPEDNLTKAPSKVQTLCKELLKTARTTTEPLNFKSSVVSNPLFSESAVLKVMLFFEQINLKGNWEKESFFTSLPEILTKIPPQIQYLQVLPQLTRQLDFYGQPALLLPSILLVGNALVEENSANKEELYRTRVIPVIIKLFKCPDRAVRYALIQHLPSFENFLSANNVEEIFDPLCLGFTDSSNLLREATLKSMCVLVPKLKKSSSIDKSIRLMIRVVQQDPEGPIRTNAVICFAKLISTFPADQTNKILGTAFLGALRDPFPPCRLAALQSIAVCSGQEIFSANDIVTRIMPVVCQRCVDSERQVRNLAFMSLEALLYQARLHLDVADTKDETDSTQKNEAPISKNQSSGWTGWALKKAIDFYGSKESGSIEAPIEAVPSGNLKSQLPSPPPTTPPIRRLSYTQKVADNHEVMDEFFDAAEAEEEWSSNHWNDGGETFELRQLDTDQEEEEGEKSINRPLEKSTRVPVLAPPPSARPPKTPTTASIKTDANQPSGENPFRQVHHTTGEKLKPLADDFWTAFDAPAKSCSVSAVKPATQSLKDIIARKSQHKKKVDDPFAEFL